MPFEYFPGQTTYGGSTSYSDSASSSGSSQNNNSSSGSSQNNNQTGQNSNNQGGQHKLKTALEKLQSQGQGNTAQAQVYKNYLAGVVSPQDQSSDKTPFSQKQTLLDDYYAGVQPTYNQYGLPSAKLDPVKLGKYNVNQPMAFGFGSVFGSSTGTTGSSQTVQDALLNMMGQYYNKYDYGAQDSINAAMANFYPEVPMYDFDGPPGTTVMGSPNYMGNKTAAELVASGHQYVEDIFKQNPTAGYGFGGGGGFGGYGGYGSGGGGGAAEVVAVVATTMMSVCKDNQNKEEK